MKASGGRGPGSVRQGMTVEKWDGISHVVHDRVNPFIHQLNTIDAELISKIYNTNEDATK